MQSNNEAKKQADNNNGKKAGKKAK